MSSRADKYYFSLRCISVEFGFYCTQKLRSAIFRWKQVLNLITFKLYEYTTYIDQKILINYSKEKEALIKNVDLYL